MGSPRSVIGIQPVIGESPSTPRVSISEGDHSLLRDCSLYLGWMQSASGGRRGDG